MTDYIPPDLLKAIQQAQGTATTLKKEITKSKIFPISQKILAERQQKKEQAFKNLAPGKLMPDGTIYLGLFTSERLKPHHLRKTFNVFAAPEDLPDTMTYIETVKHIAKLEKWHNYNGTKYKNAREIYKALENASYDGGWIIPPCELLFGSGPDNQPGKRTNNIIQPDNLFDHRNTGNFTDTFNTGLGGDGDYPGWYWSSTESLEQPSNVWTIRFWDGMVDADSKDKIRMSCRPVRLIEVTS